MSSLNPRNRVVVFRLTQDEYNLLREACIRNGARNLSDFTRSELLGRHAPGGLQARIAELEQKFAHLEVSLHGLQGSQETPEPTSGRRSTSYRRSAS